MRNAKNPAAADAYFSTAADVAVHLARAIKGMRRLRVRPPEDAGAGEENPATAEDVMGLWETARGTVYTLEMYLSSIEGNLPHEHYARIRDVLEDVNR